MLYHLAELNIARMLAPAESPIMADFVNGLAQINALAEQSTGFVWRMKDDADNAMAIRLFDDPLLIINLSVWETIESLYEYTYYSQHAEFFRRRAEWFSKLEMVGVVLWWVKAGELPTLQDAKARLEHLNTHGASPLAFTFKKRFAPPSE